MMPWGMRSVPRLREAADRNLTSPLSSQMGMGTATSLPPGETARQLIFVTSSTLKAYLASPLGLYLL